MFKRKENISQDMALRCAKYINDNGGDFTNILFGVHVVLNSDGTSFDIWDVDNVSVPVSTDSLDTLENATTWMENIKIEKLNENKPTKQKEVENSFFALTEQILTDVTDPRVGQTPPVKLSFTEINSLIKTIQATDAMAAINYSLELLAIDAELKRFNILWWNNAATHSGE